MLQILRQQIARQRVGDTDEGMNTRHFPAHERHNLVTQLEASQEQVHANIAPLYSLSRCNTSTSKVRVARG